MIKEILKLIKNVEGNVITIGIKHSKIMDKLIKKLTNYNYETASYNYDWHRGDFFAIACFSTANQLLGK